MKIEIIKTDKHSLAHIVGDEVLIRDADTAMDLLMSAKYETGCSAVVISKELVTETFFELRTKLAGEILQKCVNYHIQLAIYGDFSGYQSKALKDFIYESNHGNDIWFLGSLDEVVRRIDK